MRTLREALADWTDLDWAAHALAQCIGAIGADTEMREVKHIYWSDNALGNELVNALEALVKARVLEKRDEPDDQVRWNQAFEAPERHA